MKSWFEIEINGGTHRVEGALVGSTLLGFLRAEGLSSVKEGCDGACHGACTVVLEESGTGGASRYRAISSCVAFLPMMAGKRILTAEGVGGCEGGLAVQDAIVKSGASLCGYCTPGIVMSLFEGVHRPDMTTQRSLNEQLRGNVCRCTGYRSVRVAALQAVREMRGGDEGEVDSGEVPVGGVFNPRVSKARPSVEEEASGSKRSLEGGAGAFQYADVEGGRFYRPESLSELHVLIGQHPDGVLVAGGMGAGARIQRAREGVRCLISMEGVEDLRRVVEQEVSWEVGAGVALRRVFDMAAIAYPLLRKVLGGYSRQVLNRATVGGLLATKGGGMNEWAGVLVALGAIVRLASVDGEREVVIDQLLGAEGGLRLREGEIIVAIRLPREKASGGRTMSSHYRVPGSGGTVMVCASFMVKLDSKQGKVTSARLVFGAGPGGPRRARQAEKALTGKAWTGKSIADVLVGLESEVGGRDELRTRQAVNLFRKFYREFEAGTDEPVSLGRGDVCLEPDDDLIAGTNNGRAVNRR